MNIDKLYSKVPKEQVARLKDFRLTHPYKQLTVTKWEYISCGQGKQTFFIRNTYPRVQVHTFRDAGHASSTLKREEVLAVIRNFLKGSGS